MFVRKHRLCATCGSIAPAHCWRGIHLASGEVPCVEFLCLSLKKLVARQQWRMDDAISKVKMDIFKDTLTLISDLKIQGIGTTTLSMTHINQGVISTFVFLFLFYYTPLKREIKSRLINSFLFIVMVLWKISAPFLITVIVLFSEWWVYLIVDHCKNTYFFTGIHKHNSLLWHKR